MRSFSEIFDKRTDDKNSRSAKQEKEATYEHSCYGVAVITSALHAGLQFDPGQHQKVNYHENDE